MNEDQRRVVAQIGRFTVCQLADALGPSCAIETSIIPIDKRFRICGVAFTVKCAPGDNLTVHQALHLAQAGDVLIVGGSPNCEGALWGELMSISAQLKGLAGTIIDGPVRDPVEIQTLEYPVFCRRFHPRRVAKETLGNINIPIHIGTLSVNPGDFVVADANGIVGMSPARVHESIKLATEVAEKENRIKAQLRSGATLFDILNLQRSIPSKPRGTSRSTG
jgi:4-hydroxy-4-methyl-2-oxoglutarate aldolase